MFTAHQKRRAFRVPPEGWSRVTPAPQARSGAIATHPPLSRQTVFLSESLHKHAGFPRRTDHRLARNPGDPPHREDQLRESAKLKSDPVDQSSIQSIRPFRKGRSRSEKYPEGMPN